MFMEFKIEGRAFQKCIEIYEGEPAAFSFEYLVMYSCYTHFHSILHSFPTDIRTQTGWTGQISDPGIQLDLSNPSDLSSDCQAYS